MTVRKATVEDIPALVEMGAKFHASEKESEVAFYREGAAQFFCNLIASPQACLFTDGQGFICGVLSGLPWLDPSFVGANEMLWWSAGDGLPLFKAFEAWAASSGASQITFSHRHSERTATLARLYRMRGYEPYEHYYRKAPQPCA